MGLLKEPKKEIGLANLKPHRLFDLNANGMAKICLLALAPVGRLLNKAWQF